MKNNPNAAQLIEDYISSFPEPVREMGIKLRESIKTALPDITEDWKWGPNYQWNKQMVCGFGLFKKHATLTFFMGAFLKDSMNLLNSGTKNQHNRNIKYTSPDEINPSILKSYLLEAIEIDPSKVEKPSKLLDIPVDFHEKLIGNKLLEKFFSMPYTHQKEYILSILDAKKEETRIRRIEKAIEKINDWKK